MADDKPKTASTKTNKKSAIIGALFLVAVLVGNIIYIQASHQADEFSSALSQVSMGWLIGMGLLMVGNLLFGAAAYLFTAWLDPETTLGIRDSIAVESAGTFFGNLTPLSVGGVPGQIWRLCKAGYSPGEATAVQFARFSVYQVAQTVVATVLLLGFWGHVQATYGSIVWVSLAVVGIKVAQTTVLVLLCLFPGFVRRAGNWALGVAERWRFTNRLLGEERIERWQHNLATETERFSSAFRQLAGAWRQMLVVFILSVLQVSCLYSTDWFALRAFEVSQGFWVTLCLGTLVQLVATVVPTPGGTGGIEAAFLVFFSRYLGSAAVACFLVWRVMTFYGYTGVCGILTFLKSSRGKQKPYDGLHRLMGKQQISFGQNENDASSVQEASE